MGKERDRWEPYPPNYEANPLIWDETYLERKDRFKKLIAPVKVTEAVRDLGTKLRNQRVALGITLDEVSRQTRVQKKHLEAIESGAFDNLPGGIYLRNYIRLYADCVQFDQITVKQAFMPSHGISSDVLDVFLPNVANLAREANFARAENDSRLPKFGEFLLYFFLSRTDRVNVIGDLEEDYDSIAVKFGERAARLYFYKQITISLTPFISKFILRLVVELIEASFFRPRWGLLIASLRDS